MPLTWIKAGDVDGVASEGAGGGVGVSCEGAGWQAGAVDVKVPQCQGAHQGL